MDDRVEETLRYIKKQLQDSLEEILQKPPPVEGEVFRVMEDFPAPGHTTQIKFVGGEAVYAVTGPKNGRGSDGG